MEENLKEMKCSVSSLSVPSGREDDREPPHKLEEEGQGASRFCEKGILLSEAN